MMVCEISARHISAQNFNEESEKKRFQQHEKHLRIVQKNIFRSVLEIPSKRASKNSNKTQKPQQFT